jgi:hypothetical protein
MKTREKMIEHWRHLGIDLTGKSIMVMGYDKSHPNVDVVVVGGKFFGYKASPFDSKINPMGCFEFINKGQFAPSEKWVNLISNYGRIELFEVNGEKIVSLESDYTRIPEFPTTQMTPLDDFVSFMEQYLND